MQYVLVGFDAAQLADADALRPAYPREIVSQQIDDHHVFGAVLFAGQQFGFGRAVGGRIAGARPGALDRPRLDLAVEDLQEPFGRGADDLELAQVEVAGKRRRVAAPQPPVKRQASSRAAANSRCERFTWNASPA